MQGLCRMRRGPLAGARTAEILTRVKNGRAGLTRLFQVAPCRSRRKEWQADFSCVWEAGRGFLAPARGAAVRLRAPVAGPGLRLTSLKQG